MKKVFILDDSPEFIFLIQSLFQLKGIKLDSESDPSKVMDHVKSGSYDLMIFDYLLGDTDGLKIIEALQQVERFKELPMILLTAKKLDSQELQRVKESGVLFLPKPIQPMEFYNKVRGILGG